jgi:hypothetical protein
LPAAVLLGLLEYLSQLREAKLTLQRRPLGRRFGPAWLTIPARLTGPDLPPAKLPSKGFARIVANAYVSHRDVQPIWFGGRTRRSPFVAASTGPS